MSRVLNVLRVPASATIDGSWFQSLMDANIVHDQSGDAVKLASTGPNKGHAVASRSQHVFDVHCIMGDGHFSVEYFVEHGESLLLPP